jgi:cobalt-zinc-cadmium efflux system outer membrane protein
MRAAARLMVLGFVACARLARSEEPSGPLLAPQEMLRMAQLPETGGVAAPASGDDALTLGEAEALAVAHHPALRVAEGEVRAARGRWVQAGLRPNPVLGYSGEEIGNDGTAGMQGGFVGKEFVTAGKLRLSRAAASNEVAAAEQRLERARLQVTAIVRSYYFQALAAQRAVALSRQLTTIAAQAVRVSELRLRADDISRAALLQTQIESETTILFEQEAVNRYDAAQRQLAAVIGLDPRTQALPPLEDEFQKPLPSLDWESTRARVLTESPVLAEARFSVERARWMVARETAGRVPNVDVEAGVMFDHGTRDTVASVQVGMPIPVFDRNQGAIAAACGELAAAQATLEQQELLLEERLATALRDYLTARQRVARYVETILPATRQSLEMVTAAYQQGELDYLQLITSQQTYTSKNLSYLEDLETAWRMWARIESRLVEDAAGGMK